MANIEQMVSTSLCGLPLARAAIVIGILHSMIFGGIFLYETSLAFLKYMVLLQPAGLLSIIESGFLIYMFTSEAFLCAMASVSLVVGAWKSMPGLILTWLLQQAVLFISSFMVLFYYVIASYLKAPLIDCLFELFLNSIQGYFFVVVLAHFQELRKGNLFESNNQLIT